MSKSANSMLNRVFRADNDYCHYDDDTAVKLCYVNTLRTKVTNSLTSILYPDASKPMVDGFCSNFQGSSRICSMVHPRSFKLLCQKEAK